MSARLVFATSNAHKVSELEAILAPAWEGFEAGCVARMSDFDVASPVEDGVTFEENSLIKARALARATGLAAIADDSGITVDVLGGAPGIFSARWSGTHGDDEANLHLLLDQLSDVPDRHRGAAFVSAAVLVTPDVDEALRLSGRVVVLSERPARVVEDIAVPDGVGADEAGEDFQALRRRVLGLLGR